MSDIRPQFKLCVLASGSRGNCIFVRTPGAALLIDAGLSARETARRLELIGEPIADVRAICVSHEHSDHVAGIPVLHRQWQPALYANRGTADGVRAGRDGVTELPWNIFTTGQPFTVGDLAIEPFSVPHDALEPVGFVLRRGALRVGIATDLGMATTLIRERLRGCRALVLEANHDEHLLKNSKRPWPLIQRIASRQGHLSNRHALDLLRDLCAPELEQVFLAHLSDECNTPDVALQDIAGGLREAGATQVRVEMTWPDRPSAVWTVDE